VGTAAHCAVYTKDVFVVLDVIKARIVSSVIGIWQIPCTHVYIVIDRMF